MVGWPALPQDEQGKQQPKAQDYEHRIREIVREFDPDPLRGDAYAKVRRIVAMGREAVPALTKLLKEGILHGGVLDALSFVLRPGDEEAIKVIQEYAFAPKTGGSEEAVRKASWSGGAILALLRIGGTAARSVIDRVAEKEDWEFQINVVDASWLMLGVEDLEYAKGERPGT